jgi:hypothetical protein
MLRALTCEAYILKGNHEVVGSIPTSRFAAGVAQR